MSLIVRSDLQFDGVIEFRNQGLMNIISAKPWRLDGEIHTMSGTSRITGTPFIVGSDTGGDAFIHAEEPLIIESDVTLESTAKVDATTTGGALGSITFAGKVNLFGPDINGVVGAWPGREIYPEVINQPSTVSFFSDVTVQEESLIYAGNVYFGDSVSPAPAPMSINLNADFTVDARFFINQPQVSMFINESTFRLNLRGSANPGWSNNMSVTLNESAFRVFQDTDAGVSSDLQRGRLCNHGSFRGKGKIHSSLLAVDSSGADCAGAIAPGLLTPGVIAVSGDVRSSSMTFEMDIAGESITNYDRVETNGDIIIDGGELIVKFIDDYIPAVNTQFKLFLTDGYKSINFSSIELEGLPSNYRVNSSQLDSTGIISIVKRRKQFFILECYEHPFFIFICEKTNDIFDFLFSTSSEGT